MAKSKDAVEIMRKLIGEDPEMERMLKEERERSEVAQMIYDARVRANLTQRELAERVGTTQPVIARLERAGYSGHSLSMVRRIAHALGQRLELRLVPEESDKHSARPSAS